MARTIVVTGASSGVGLAAAEQFAALGDQVVVVGRDPGRLAAAVEPGPGGRSGPRAGPVPGRLRAARTTYASWPRTCWTRTRGSTSWRTTPAAWSSEYRRTADGFEATIQSNHLGPFLLTNLLRERLAGGRVVNTASDAHRRRPARPGRPRRRSGHVTRRGRPTAAAKAANILFAAEAARRWPDITSVSFHPGVVRSNFGAGRADCAFFYRYAPFLVTPEKAGALLVWLATAPAAELVDGGYYVGHQLTEPAGHAKDPAAAAKLWDASAAAVGL